MSTLTRLSVTVTQRYTLGQMSVRTKSAFLRPYMFCAYCASSMRLIQQQLFTNCCLPTQPSPQGQTICSAASRTSASASRWLLAGALHRLASPPPSRPHREPAHSTRTGQRCPFNRRATSTTTLFCFPFRCPRLTDLSTFRHALAY